MRTPDSLINTNLIGGAVMFELVGGLATDLSRFPDPRTATIISTGLAASAFVTIAADWIINDISSRRRAPPARRS